MVYLASLLMTATTFFLSKAFTITAIILALIMFHKIYHLLSQNIGVGLPTAYKNKGQFISQGMEDCDYNTSTLLQE